MSENEGSERMNENEDFKVGDTLEVTEGHQEANGDWLLIPGERVKVTHTPRPAFIEITAGLDGHRGPGWNGVQWNKQHFKKVTEPDQRSEETMTEEDFKVGDILEVIEGHQVSGDKWALVLGEKVKVARVQLVGTSPTVDVTPVLNRSTPAGWSHALWDIRRFKKVDQNRNEIIMSDDEETMSSRTILEEAADIIDGDRRDDYGDATESFERIAQAWSAAVFDRPVTAAQVAAAMAILKICRFRTAQDRDSLVDLAGYAALAAEIKGL